MYFVLRYKEFQQLEDVQVRQTRLEARLETQEVVEWRRVEECAHEIAETVDISELSGLETEAEQVGPGLRPLYVSASPGCDSDDAADMDVSPVGHHSPVYSPLVESGPDSSSDTFDQIL